MPSKTLWSVLASILLCAVAGSPASRAEPTEQADPLGSWREGPAKQSIVDFVSSVVDPESDGFVPPKDRIATFDNDGCLWSEQPLYFQALFAFDRIRALAPEHPEWRVTEPYKSVLEGDTEHVMQAGKQQVLEMLIAAHAGVTGEEFDQIVRDWLEVARHPSTGKAFTEMVFQPMLELIDYLHSNEFRVFIVSGGGIDFLRVFSQDVYDIPPERVVGSSIGARFEMREGIPVVIKTPELAFVDDKEGKPVGIHQHIGRRPIFAAGNSDGDLQMLQYTTILRGPGDTTPRLGVLIHHTDADREWAYDRDSHVGRLDAALDEAPERGWVVVDMRDDWSRVYPAADP